MIKILIVDDHAIVRRGIREIVESISEVTHVDEAVSGAEALKMMSSTDYNILLLDISMPGESGLDVLKQMKKVMSEVRTIILSMYYDELYIVNAFKLGALGYVTKDNTPEELEEAIMTAWEGKRYISPDLEKGLPADIESLPNIELSKRELQVVCMLAEGLSDKEIASKLGISEKTVQTYTTSVYKKLDTNNRTETAIKAIKLGFVTG